MITKKEVTILLAIGAIVSSITVADRAAAALPATSEMPELTKLIDKAQTLYYEADAKQPSEKKDKRKLYNQGLETAEIALKSSPKDSAALIWWAANQSGAIQTGDLIAAISKVKDVEKALLQAKEADPRYYYGAADRALGVIYDVVPAIISIGSKEKAHFHFKQAYEREPRFIGNQVLLAKFLAKNNITDQAKTLATKALSPESQTPFKNKYNDSEINKWIADAKEILTLPDNPPQKQKPHD